MASSSWLDCRRRWRDAFVAVHGVEPACAVCGEPWTLRRGDLHHRSYDRLGHERFDDLVPLCRACHERVHRIFERTPGWRRLPRAQASDAIVSRLHASASREKAR
jgi:5-methylcytosine-specific restriction endonuclease McrA